MANASGALDYFNGPAFLSWSRGQGQASTGGYDIFHGAETGGALPPWWFEQQAALGRQQAQRMREYLCLKAFFDGLIPTPKVGRSPRVMGLANCLLASGINLRRI